MPLPSVSREQSSSKILLYPCSKHQSSDQELLSTHQRAGGIHVQMKVKEGHGPRLLVFLDRGRQNSVEWWFLSRFCFSLNISLLVFSLMLAQELLLQLLFIFQLLSPANYQSHTIISKLLAAAKLNWSPWPAICTGFQELTRGDNTTSKTNHTQQLSAYVSY